MNLCILGAGAWGTALAVRFATLDHSVTLVARRLEQALELAQTRENTTYLPGVKLPASLQIGLELLPALMEAELVLFACPSKHLAETARAVKESLTPAWNIRALVVCCKGLESETNLLPCEVLARELPGFSRAVLSGPSFADEVGSGLPTALVFATDGGEAFARETRNSLSGKGLRVYSSDDIIGVELGGCLKNVYAVAAGLSDGLKLGHNAKAALVTRSLAEMMKVGSLLGGRAETFLGLGGVGDLMLTTQGPQSRNRSLGERIAQGQNAADAIHALGTAEGYRASRCFHEICAARGLPAPILEQVYHVLHTGRDPRHAVHALLNRDPRSES